MTSDRIPRRSFSSVLIGVLGAATAAIAGVPAAMYLLAKEKTAAWVVKTDAQHVVAFAPQCTHLGCIYHWEAEASSFVCPCHASAFGIDGAVLDGPAPRPLDRHVTRIERGKVLIGPDIVKA